MLQYRTPIIKSILGPLVWTSPIMAWASLLIRQKRNLFAKDYDLLIDGYPRSGNTFATEFFALAFDPAPRVRSHVHNPAAVVAAISQKKPTLVLIRNPEDAIASWIVRSNYSPSYAIRQYIHYYRVLLRYIGRFCVSDFKDTTGDIAKVYTKLNRHFGLRYEPSGTFIDLQARIFTKIDSRFENTHGELNLMQVSRPAEERQNEIEKVKKTLASDSYSKLIDNATHLYKAFHAASCY